MLKAPVGRAWVLYRTPKDRTLRLNQHLDLLSSKVSVFALVIFLISMSIFSPEQSNLGKKGSTWAPSSRVQSLVGKAWQRELRQLAQEQPVREQREMGAQLGSLLPQLGGGAVL